MVLLLSRGAIALLSTLLFGYAGANVRVIESMSGALKASAHSKSLIIPLIGDESYLQSFTPSNENSESDCIYISIEDCSDLFSISGGDVGILSLSAQTILLEAASVVSQLAAVFESSLLHRDNLSLVIVVDIKKKCRNSRFLEANLKNLVKEAWASTRFDDDKMSSALAYEICLVDKSDDKSISNVKSTILDSISSAAPSAMLIESLLKVSHTNIKNDTPIDEANSAVACNKLTKYLFSLLDSFQDALVSSSNGMVDLDSLRSIIRNASETIEMDMAVIEQKWSKTKAYKDAVVVIQTKLLSILVSAYDSMSLALLNAAKSEIRKITRKVPPGQSLVQKLKASARVALKSFEADLNKLRLDTCHFWGDLQNSELLSLSSPSSLPIKHLLTMRHVDELRAYCDACVKDRHESQFLQGSYNPFVRTAPFPPTHLNFNYLLDPRGLRFGYEYDRLYEENKDGIASHRADPLFIPNIARIPFDPNQHPVGEDDAAWLTVLRESFPRWKRKVDE